MPHSSNLSFLGIAKETVPGTGVAPTAFIPVTGPSGKDALTMLADKGLRGAMVDTYDEIAGPKSGTFEFGGDVFPDTVGWVLAGILGDVTTTGTVAPFTHTMAALNSGDGQPKSYTFSDYYSVAARQYPGAKYSELDFKFAGTDMFTWTAKTTTFGSKPTTKPTQSYTDIPPLAGWVGTVKIDDTEVDVVLDGEIDIKRDVSILNAVNGSQDPASIWCGALTCTGKLTIVMETEDYLNDYLNNANKSLEIDYSTGEGTDAVQVNFKMSKVKWTAAEIDRGSDYVTIGITWEALANTDDIGASAGYSPLKVTLQNAIASGVYA